LAPSIAVVVPTLNEQELLAALLPELAAEADELVVADGGSVDDTVGVARRAGAEVVTASGGRGPQLNAGAGAARCDGLVFLHADTRLPSGGLGLVRNALADGVVGGGFLVRFEGTGPLYRLGAWAVNQRTLRLRIPLGDQAQFASVAAFRAIGGFPDWPILEDLEFIRRLRALGPLAVLEPPVATSARRFERGGPARTVVRNWLIFALFSLGMPPRLLRGLYRPEPIRRQAP
jgi:rSAM/selenodomain-associated transferase 2